MAASSSCPHQHGRGRPPRLLATAVGCALLGLAPAAHATAYTITVDASKQTAGNPHFWSASVGTGTASLTLRSDLQTHYKILNRELGMQRVRGHGVLNDDIGIYKSAGTYDFTKFDTYLNAIVSAGMRPIMELSFMPTGLAKSGNSRDVPKDMTAYKQFITAVVQHCVDKYGAEDVGKWYWEVWNEPDYPGFWNGTITDYYALYDAAVDALTSVLPNVLVGGPATTEPGKIGAFLSHCKSANKRVTFASSHSYPGGNGTSPANAASLVNDNNTRITQISNGGYTTATVKSFNTEWNSSYSGQGGGTGDALESMDSHANAPFIIKAAKLLSDKNSGDTPPVEVFSYWVGSDVFDESSGPSGSYILGKNNGQLPFGRVFGLMTFQGIRKAAFNGFKMLNYLGPKRLMSGGGTGSDGVDAMATMSAAGDELQVLVYDYYSTIKTTGTDDVTINVSNLPATLAGKELFVTHFRVDETHSNPYSVWLGQNKPGTPTEAQLQELKAAQHLALLEPVSKATVTTSYTTKFTISRQGASLILLGVNRPVTGRNALVDIEAEDYDGQSGVTKEDSKDATLGQSITGAKDAWVYFEKVDFSDAGVSKVDLRVSAAAATTLELHADTQTGPLVGTCAIASTSGAWASQSCTLTPTTGVHKLYAVFGGSMRLNYFKFSGSGGSTPGTGGTGGGATGGTGNPGTGGTSAGGTGGTKPGATGGTSPGATGGTGPSATGGTTSPGTGGDSTPTGTGGTPSATGGSTTTPPADNSSSGCSCQVTGSSAPWAGAFGLGLAAMFAGARRRRPRR